MQDLVEKYPTIFSPDFEFECGSGWYHIIDCVCAVIKNEGCKAVQVKEKFGELRFYTDRSTDLVDGAVYTAMLISTQTCESCGNKGKIRSGNWITTRCDTC